MKAFELLHHQHRIAERLFDQLASTPSPFRRQSLLTELGDALTVHMAVEERILYPALTHLDAIDAQLREALEEHLWIKRILAELLQTSPSDEQFAARLAVLRAQVARHVESEEHVLFVRAGRALSEETQKDLGARMDALAEHLMTDSGREVVSEQIRHIAPLS